MGTPLASGVQPHFALKMRASSSSARAFASSCSGVSNSTVSTSLPLMFSIITWYSLDVPSVAAMTSSTWAGKMLQPFTLNMSSVRPVSVSMRGWRWPKPHLQSPGMMRVRSCVR